MNIYYNIDKYLLTKTEQIARFTYRWIGMNNFGIAKAATLCTILISLVGIFLVIYITKNTKEAPTVAIFLLMLAFFLATLIFGLLFLERINSFQKKYKIGFVNSMRHLLHLPRIFFLFVMIMFWVRLFRDDPIIESVVTTVAFCIFAFLCTSLYFASIEPEPPSESKLRKGINRLRSLLTFSSPLPSPT